uniref:Uncharacterized protein n=1 Tax=Kryptolebias marmoratus TaxID=37003 RepID=A0A3Q3EN37_KRYMA
SIRNNCVSGFGLRSKPRDRLTPGSDGCSLPPSNFLEIKVYDSQIVGAGRNQHEVHMRANLPVSGADTVTERLQNELEGDGKKALKRQTASPLVQNQRCLHVFLQKKTTDRNYIPSLSLHCEYLALNCHSWT